MGYIENIKSKIEDFNTAVADSTSKYFNYLRALTVIATGFLGLLIGLKPEKIPDCTSKYLFLSTITLMSLGIFFSVVSQFYEVVYAQKLVDARDELLTEYIHDPSKKFQSKTILKPIFYKISDAMTFCCYGLSIATLICYVWFLELG